MYAGAHPQDEGIIELEFFAVIGGMPVADILLVSEEIVQSFGAQAHHVRGSPFHAAADDAADVIELGIVEIAVLLALDFCFRESDAAGRVDEYVIHRVTRPRPDAGEIIHIAIDAVTATATRFIGRIVETRPGEIGFDAQDKKSIWKL